MMSSLLIFGAGGHGKVVAESARLSGLWHEVDFVDDRFPGLSKIGEYRVIANFSDGMKLSQSYQDAIVAIGDNRNRLILTKQLKDAGFNLAKVIHPEAIIAKSASIGKGAVILAGSVLQADSKLGMAVIVNTAVSVDHDCIIADGVHLSPGTHLGGSVTVGECSWLGIGTVVINDIYIGHDTVIGAGAAVTQAIPDNSMAVGVPAKLKKLGSEQA